MQPHWRPSGLFGDNKPKPDSGQPPTSNTEPQVGPSGLFAGNTTKHAFGQPSSLNAQTQSRPHGLFGDNTANPIFGQPFASNTEDQSPFGRLFASPGAKPASAQLFGSDAQPQASTGGLFGGNARPFSANDMLSPISLSSRPAPQAQTQPAGLFGDQTITPNRTLSHQSSTQTQTSSRSFAGGKATYGGFGLPNQRTPMHQHSRMDSAFIAAINLKDKDKVEELLSLITDPKEIDRALDIVATSGDPALMKILLSSPHANVDGLSCDTPLFRASLERHIEVMKILLDQGADPNKGSRGVRSQGCVMVGVPPDDQLSNPLHAVAGFHTLHGINRPSLFTKQPKEHELIQAEECCQLLLDAGCNPNAKGYRGYTPLHISAGSNLITVAKALLENGADPFIATNTGTTPLHLVGPFKESIPMIELLTSRGLKLDKTYSSDGSAPIHDIFKDDHQLDLKLLAPYVTDWNTVDNKGETLLHQLMRCRKSPSRAFVASLIELGADVRRKSYEGLEPIHIAASTYSGTVQMPNTPSLGPIIQLLLVSGADIEAKDSKGLTPLHHVIINTKSQDKSHEAIGSFIRQFQPKIHAIDNDGNGVLHFALQEGPPNGFFGRTGPWSPDTLNALVKMGADPLHVNHAGETPLDTLMQSTHAKAGKVPLEIVQALLKYGVSITSQSENRKDGNTLLHVYCQTRLDPDIGEWPDQKLIDLLLSSLDLKSIEMPNRAGFQPIHLVACWREREGTEIQCIEAMERTEKETETKI